jgi:ABC-type dipeptide/oligopeptide/nickel transport system ATPase component
MVVKLFILGCSGSGKSTAARRIAMLARDRGWSATHISDYEILFNLFLKDVNGTKFHPALFGGFDVLDLSVYDTALLELKHQAHILYSKADELLIIEFARDNYCNSFRLFGNSFLKDAYFLFIDSDPEICIRRIHNRVIHRTSLDDHFVPEHVVNTFLHKENKQYLASDIKTDYGITDERVKIIINNTDSSMSFFNEITQFAGKILKQEGDIEKETDKLRSIHASASMNEPSQKAIVSQETEPLHKVTPVDETAEL